MFKKTVKKNKHFLLTPVNEMNTSQAIMAGSLVVAGAIWGMSFALSYTFHRL